MEMKKIKSREVSKPPRMPSLNMLTMADIITGVNAVLNPGKPLINWFAPAADAVAAVRVKDGKAEVTNPAVLYDGEVSDKEISKLKVVAYAGNEGGIYAEGAGTDVTVDGAYISLAGDGEGIGGPSSGAAAKFGAKLTIRDAVINTTGRTRYSTAAEEGSVLKVYDSVIWSHGIPYGEGIPAPAALMSTPPPPLEIEGNTRTHCTMSNSQSYFYNSKIICDGWAALSTESSEGYVYLEANDCDIICTKNGYGAYSDPGCHDVFNRCNLEMARMAAIVAGNSDMTFNDCEAKCGSYFALMHCVNGWQEEVSEVSVNGGYIRTEKEAFLVKSHNALIELNGVDIASNKGILVHGIVNDDPCTTPVNYPPFGINVRFSDMTTEGDLIHEDPSRDMWVEMKSSLLSGAIRGAKLSMDIASKWIATADSDVTLLTDLEPAQIDAAEGITVTVYGGEDAEFTLASGGKLIVKA